ncbi:MAG: hypothetical protein H6818_05235 [Phycisphaerales bacterium]|nr:hypothetical protein [Phycisphaerales bacterium]MCB9863411.1 hypothetical protein [Phycisphaerales bacterium]
MCQAIVIASWLGLACAPPAGGLERYFVDGVLGGPPETYEMRVSLVSPPLLESNEFLPRAGIRLRIKMLDGLSLETSGGSGVLVRPELRTADGYADDAWAYVMSTLKVTLKRDCSIQYFVHLSYHLDDQARGETVTVEGELPIWIEEKEQTLYLSSEDHRHILAVSVKKLESESKGKKTTEKQAPKVERFSLGACLVELRDKPSVCYDQVVGVPADLTCQKTKWYRTQVRLEDIGGSDTSWRPPPTASVSRQRTTLKATPRTFAYPAEIDVVFKHIDDHETRFEYRGTIEMAPDQCGPIVRSEDGKYLLIFRWFPPSAE